MKKAWRIHIHSWTASFRYPNIISGFQPTLEVPPISTILGLINAAMGRYQYFKDLDFGYYFEYEAKATDLETIYQFEVDKKGKPFNRTKSNVIQREFLFENNLWIYTNDDDIAEGLKHPHYPLLLGRMNDLASVKEVKIVELFPVDSTDKKIKGQVVPFNGNYLPGQIQALPKYFTDEIPRRNLGTEPYSIINWKAKDSPSSLTVYRDEIDRKRVVDIYFHELSYKSIVS